MASQFLEHATGVTRTQARRDTIREAAEQRNRENPRKLDIRALMLDEAATHFRSLFFGEAPSARTPAHPSASPAPDGVFVRWSELGLVRQFVNDAQAGPLVFKADFKHGLAAALSLKF